jgi:hypothetical protein
VGGSAGGVGALAGLNGFDLGAFVAASCEASGVPVKVTDPGAVRAVVTLLSGTAGGSGVAAPSQTRSDPPDEADPVRVERLAG